MTHYFDEGEKAEIKELYLKDNYKSVRELAKIFKVSAHVMGYFVNYRGYREKYIQYGKEWRKKNPERHREISRIAVRKYNQTEKGRARIKKSGRKKTHWERLRRLLTKQKGSATADKIIEALKKDDKIQRAKQRTKRGL